MTERRALVHGTAVAAERLLGFLFVGAAVLKALDIEAFAVQITYYGVIGAPRWVWMAAIGSVAFETLVGVAMLLGLRARGWTFAAVLASLAVFSGLIVYGWALHDLKDCGCFGSYLPMGPGASLVKNAAMAALAAWAWYGLRGAVASAPLSRHAVIKATVCLASFAVVALAGMFHVPFERECRLGYHFVDETGRDWDLRRGTYLVAVMSATCDHCKSIAPELDEYLFDPELPPVVGLMLAEDDREMDFFRALVDFPLTTMPPVEWMAIIGEEAPREPPRFFLVHDCAELAHWNYDLPPADAVKEAMARAGL